MLLDPDDPQEERIQAALKRLQLTHLRETLTAVLSEAAKGKWTWCVENQAARGTRVPSGFVALSGLFASAFEALAA